MRPTMSIRQVKSQLLASCAAITLMIGIASSALANPVDGRVVAGDASITQTGPKELTINQGSNRAVIDWRRFDIDPDEHTRFVQPNSGSVALNRVTGSADPSRILGRLSANGRVIIQNPNGVLFGQGARVDVNSIVATTHDIRTDDFMAGRDQFTIPGNPTATVVNEGTITAAEAGVIALIAPGVENRGTLSARLGKVTLASGDAFTLDFNGDDLIKLVVDRKTADITPMADGRPLSALVSSSGTIQADGGAVTLTTNAVRDLLRTTINMDGLIQARAAEGREGKIVLHGGESGDVFVTGTLDAGGTEAASKGGTIIATGENVGLMAGARLDASGDVGGGRVLIGGERLGGGTLQRAKAVHFDAAASVSADAIRDGKGGEVIVWSDEFTRFMGAITARGGVEGGDGGFVETSSLDVLQVVGTVGADARTEGALGGEWLLDPTDINISLNPTFGGTLNGGTFSLGDSISANINSSSIVAALNAGIHVNINTSGSGQGVGIININAPIIAAEGSSARLSLRANRDIYINSKINIGGAFSANSLSGNIEIGDEVDVFSGGSVALTGGSYSYISIGKKSKLYGRESVLLSAKSFLFSDDGHSIDSDGRVTINAIADISGNGPTILNINQNFLSGIKSPILEFSDSFDGRAGTEFRLSGNLEFNGYMLFRHGAVIGGVTSLNLTRAFNDVAGPLSLEGTFYGALPGSTLSVSAVGFVNISLKNKGIPEVALNERFETVRINASGVNVSGSVSVSNLIVMAGVSGISINSSQGSLFGLVDLSTAGSISGGNFRAIQLKIMSSGTSLNKISILSGSRVISDSEVAGFVTNVSASGTHLVNGTSVPTFQPPVNPVDPTRLSQFQAMNVTQLVEALQLAQIKAEAADPYWSAMLVNGSPTSIQSAAVEAVANANAAAAPYRTMSAEQLAAAIRRGDIVASRDNVVWRALYVNGQATDVQVAAFELASKPTLPPGVDPVILARFQAMDAGQLLEAIQLAQIKGEASDPYWAALFVSGAESTVQAAAKAQLAAANAAADPFRNLGVDSLVREIQLGRLVAGSNAIWRALFQNGAATAAQSAAVSAVAAANQAADPFRTMTVDQLVTAIRQGTITASIDNAVWRALFINGEPTATQRAALEVIETPPLPPGVDPVILARFQAMNVDQLVEAIQLAQIKAEVNDPYWRALYVNGAATAVQQAAHTTVVNASNAANPYRSLGIDDLVREIQLGNLIASSNNLVWRALYVDGQATQVQTAAYTRVVSAATAADPFRSMGVDDLVREIQLARLRASADNPVWRALYVNGQPTSTQADAFTKVTAAATAAEPFRGLGADALAREIQLGRLSASEQDTVWRALYLQGQPSAVQVDAFTKLSAATAYVASFRSLNADQLVQAIRRNNIVVGDNINWRALYVNGQPTAVQSAASGVASQASRFWTMTTTELAAEIRTGRLIAQDSNAVWRSLYDNAQPSAVQQAALAENDRIRRAEDAARRQAEDAARQVSIKRDEALIMAPKSTSPEALGKIVVYTDKAERDPENSDDKVKQIKEIRSILTEVVEEYELEKTGVQMVIDMGAGGAIEWQESGVRGGVAGALGAGGGLTLNLTVTFVAGETAERISAPLGYLVAFAASLGAVDKNLPTSERLSTAHAIAKAAYAESPDVTKKIADDLGETVVRVVTNLSYLFLSSYAENPHEEATKRIDAIMQDTRLDDLSAFLMQHTAGYEKGILQFSKE